ncbi:hypothetical protein ABEB36_001792 [Hypothenemus hampei]|uniref:RING-type E3 ubiquitin transferase n=1 Tax=Hypothenemus hampei TaxID=57062 RepID=A0ABD1FGS8_HYPHA
MAEAAVEERHPTRFYCHVCNVEFQSMANNFTCPHCSDGFIEELQDTRDTDSGYTNYQTGATWRPPDAEMEDAGFLLSTRFGSRSSDNATNADGRPLTRLATSNLRQQLPIEHLVQDFIINLGVGVNLGGPGNVQLFLGNPGDYAWGREGLDAIVTQLLNQMDSTGPPPLSKAVIDALQIVEVTEEQVAQKLQCSVCWEYFTVKEPVRQLPCLHIYHEGCIRPWLELHGTCPICRQNLGEGEGDNQNSADSSGTNVHDVLRSLFNAAPSSSSSSGGADHMDQSEPSSS